MNCGKRGIENGHSLLQSSYCSRVNGANLGTSSTIGSKLNCTNSNRSFLCEIMNNFEGVNYLVKEAEVVAECDPQRTSYTAQKSLDCLR